MDDDDPDYEVGEEERERARVRPHRGRAGGAGSAGAGGARSGGYGAANELSELRDQWAQEEDAPVRGGRGGAPGAAGAHLGPGGAGGRGAHALAGAPPYLHAPQQPQQHAALLAAGLPPGARLSAEQLAMLEAQAQARARSPRVYPFPPPRASPAGRRARRTPPFQRAVVPLLAPAGRDAKVVRAADAGGWRGRLTRARARRRGTWRCSGSCTCSSSSWSRSS